MEWEDLTDQERETLAALPQEQRAVTLELLTKLDDLSREGQAAMLKLIRLLHKRQTQPLTADEINRCVERLLALGMPFQPLADLVAALESREA